MELSGRRIRIIKILAPGWHFSMTTSILNMVEEVLESLESSIVVTLREAAKPCSRCGCGGIEQSLSPGRGWPSSLTDLGKGD